MTSIALTQFSHGGGCGCKIAPGLLAEILSRAPAGLVPPTLLAAASTEHVWVDAGTRRPVRFPQELKAPFERFLPAAGALAAVD